jgi:hypothetical protein
MIFRKPGAEANQDALVDVELEVVRTEVFRFCRIRNKGFAGSTEPQQGTVRQGSRNYQG